MKKVLLGAIAATLMSGSAYAADIPSGCQSDSGSDYYYGQLQNRRYSAFETNLKGGYYVCSSEDDYYEAVDQVDDEYFDDGKDGELEFVDYPNARQQQSDANVGDCTRVAAGHRVKVLETNWVRAARIEMCNGGERAWTHVDNLIGWHPKNIGPNPTWYEDADEDTTQSLNR